mgnify:FL=1
MSVTYEMIDTTVTIEWMRAQRRHEYVTWLEQQGATAAVAEHEQRTSLLFARAASQLDGQDLADLEAAFIGSAAIRPDDRILMEAILLEGGDMATAYGALWQEAASTIALEMMMARTRWFMKIFSLPTFYRLAREAEAWGLYAIQLRYDEMKGRQGSDRRLV